MPRRDASSSPGGWGRLSTIGAKSGAKSANFGIEDPSRPRHLRVRQVQPLRRQSALSAKTSDHHLWEAFCASPQAPGGAHTHWWMACYVAGWLSKHPGPSHLILVRATMEFQPLSCWSVWAGYPAYPPGREHCKPERRDSLL